jgi:hypothetical protein
MTNRVKIMVAVAVLLILTAVLLSLGGGRYPGNVDKQDEFSAQSATPVSSQNEITFQVSTIGEGPHSSSTSYESSDGKLISINAITLASTSKANRRLEEKLRSAKVIERGPKMSKQGQRVGERILALLPNREGKEEMAACLWTYGPVLWLIQSSSMEHVLLFEKFHIGRSE